MPAFHAPGPIELRSGNDRKGASREGPVAQAERPLFPAEATFADTSSSYGLAPQAGIFEPQNLSTTVDVEGDRNSNTGIALFSFSISGYLVDVP